MGKKAKLYMTTRPDALVICFSCFLLPLKLAERARVRASGSTAASSHAWLLRLSRPRPGYKKYSKTCRFGQLGVIESSMKKTVKKADPSLYDCQYPPLCTD